MSSNGPPAVLVIKNRMKLLNNDIDHLKEELSKRDKIIEEEAEKKLDMDKELFFLIKKLQFVELEKEKFEMELKEAVESLELINKDTHKNERSRKIMENRQNADIDRIDQLEQQIKFSMVSTEEATRNCDELQKKASYSAHLLEEAETRCTKGDNRIKRLESDLKTIITKLKSLESQKEQAVERESYYDRQIQCLQLQVKAAEERALLSESEVIKQQQEMDNIKDELERERNNYHYIKKEFDAIRDGYFGV